MAPETGNAFGGFPAIMSKVVTSDPAFKENASSWVALLEKFESSLQWAASEGKRHHIQ